MPLVIIKSLAPADSGALAPMLEDVRDAGARAIGDAPSNIWVMFEPLPPACYLQETRVPVVLIKAKSGRTREQREAFMAAVATAVGKGLSVPAGGVWVHYDEIRPEDVRYGH